MSSTQVDYFIFMIEREGHRKKRGIRTRVHEKNKIFEFYCFFVVFVFVFVCCFNRLSTFNVKKRASLTSNNKSLLLLFLLGKISMPSLLLILFLLFYYCFIFLARDSNLYYNNNKKKKKKGIFNSLLKKTNEMRIE